MSTIDEKSKTSLVDVEEEEEELIPGWRTWLAVFASVMILFTGFFEVIYLGTYFPEIVKELGSPELGPWIPNVFELVTASLAGVVARISDTTGRRWIVIYGVGISVIGNILMATAKSTPIMLVGSAFLSFFYVNQGNFYSMPSELLPRRWRGVGSTITAGGGGLGAVICLVLGGYVNQPGGLGWRAGIIAAAILKVFVCGLLYFFYDPPNPPSSEGKTIIYVLKKEIDWVGTFLLIPFMLPFMIGLTLGSTGLAWTSATVLGSLAVGAFFLISLVIHQVFLNKHGILDHDLFVSRNFAICLFGLFIEGVLFLTFLVFYPLQVSILWSGGSVLSQSARLIPFFLAFGIISPVVGYYTRKTRDLKSPLVVGWTLVLIGIVVLSQLGLKDAKISIFVIFLAGVGFSTPLALLNACAQLSVPKQLLGLATGQIVAARALGTAVGTSFQVAIFGAKLAVFLPDDIATAAIQTGLPISSIPVVVAGIATGNVTLAMTAPGVTPEILEAAGAASLQAYDAFSFGWYASIPFLALSVIAALSLDSNLLKSAMDNRGKRSVEKNAILDNVSEVSTKC